MTDVILRAENVGKSYLIGHQAEKTKYTTLRDVVAKNAQGFWRKTKELAHGKQILYGDSLEEVWALKDINFEIRTGEAVGIIGRNGAGKSTLLKILSRITEPSTGRITIKGRVASLLEVGTGFHPELTGRENVYLNGAILGMTRQEIKRKFDEIVAFAEVEKYLDTPVKRYSSGMYVRLAFAVAAHLEPEILVVDEVLAVGDAEFQKKCLGKMEDVTGEGRTVLFVSHNMAAIQKLCQRALLLQSGRIVDIGEATTVVSNYIDSIRNSRQQLEGGSFHLAPYSILSTLSLSTADETPQTVFELGSNISVRLSVKSNFVQQIRHIGLAFEDTEGQRIFVAATQIQAPSLLENIGDEHEIICQVHKVPLLPGDYFITVVVAGLHNDLERLDQALFFTIIESDIYGTGVVPVAKRHGIIAIKSEWQVKPLLAENSLYTKNLTAHKDF